LSKFNGAKTNNADEFLLSRK